MKTQQTGSTLDIIIFVLLVSTIYVALLVIPVGGDVKDVYVDVSIRKPLVGFVEFTSVEAVAQPHTFLSVPSLGNILTSGKVTVTAQTTSIKAQAVVGEIYRTSDTTARIILKKVPIDENEVTVKLFEDNSLAQTMKVVIT